MAYEKALPIDPSTESTWMRQALELQVLGREKRNPRRRLNERAMTLINGHLGKNPQDYKAWIREGLALSNLGRQRESNQANQNALEIPNRSLVSGPENAITWRRRAEALMSTGRWDDGLASPDKVSEVNHRDYGAWERKGEFLTVSAEIRSSLQAIQIRRDP